MLQPQCGSLCCLLHPLFHTLLSALVSVVYYDAFSIIEFDLSSQRGQGKGGIGARYNQSECRRYQWHPPLGTPPTRGVSVTQRYHENNISGTLPPH